MWCCRTTSSSIDRRTGAGEFQPQLDPQAVVPYRVRHPGVRYLARSDTAPVRTNSLDIGLGYGDGLTFALGRHTTLSLSVGASIAKNGDPASVAASPKTAFVVNGAATLSRSLAAVGWRWLSAGHVVRAWLHRAGYDRLRERWHRRTNCQTSAVFGRGGTSRAARALFHVERFDHQLHRIVAPDPGGHEHLGPVWAGLRTTGFRSLEASPTWGSCRISIDGA